MGLDATAEEPLVILSGFHYHGKISQLCCTVTNIQTMQIVLHDADYRFTGGIAVALIDLHQHIEQIGKDMAGTAAWVDDLDLLWGQAAYSLRISASWACAFGSCCASSR